MYVFRSNTGTCDRWVLQNYTSSTIRRNESYLSLMAKLQQFIKPSQTGMHNDVGCISSLHRAGCILLFQVETQIIRPPPFLLFSEVGLGTETLCHCGTSSNTSSIFQYLPVTSYLPFTNFGAIQMPQCSIQCVELLLW